MTLLFDAVALPSAIYVLAVSLFASSLLSTMSLLPLGSTQSIATMIGWLAVLVMASGAYILDRVKLAGSHMDPADDDAHEVRMRFARTHHRILRTFAMVELCAGSVLLAISSWLMHAPVALQILAVCAGPAAILAGLVYAPGPARSGLLRGKDVLVLKPLLVACAVTGLALLPDIVTMQLKSPAWREAALIVCVLVWVVGDAILSDIDDVESDQRWGTDTVPGRIGAKWAVFACIILHGVVVVVLACTAVFGAAFDAKMCIAVVCFGALTGHEIIVFLMNTQRPVRRMRHSVDTRLAIASGLVLASYLLMG